LERFPFDEDRPSRLDCELRFEPVEPRLERELVLFDTGFPDVFPDFADRDAEFARAIWSLPDAVPAETVQGCYTRALRELAGAPFSR